MKGREKLLRSVYEKKRLSAALKFFSSEVSLLLAAVLCVLLLILMIEGEHFRVLKILLTAAVPFFAVGIARRLIGAKRPFELYDFYEKSPKSKLFGLIKNEKSDTGTSFPSRHAYSAFVISTLIFFICPWQGVLFGIISALMCVCRVLLGIHFIRDVLCGAFVGVISGVLGELLLKF